MSFEANNGSTRSYLPKEPVVEQYLLQTKIVFFRRKYLKWLLKRALFSAECNYKLILIISAHVSLENIEYKYKDDVDSKILFYRVLRKDRVSFLLRFVAVSPFSLKFRSLHLNILFLTSIPEVT